MPLDDFLIGAALFGAMLAAVAIATALVVRRRLRHLDALELGLASVVVGTLVLTGVHLLPLMLGMLTRGTVLAASVLAVGLAALVRPAADDGVPDASARPPAAPSRAVSWALAAIAAAFATAAALGDLGRWAGDELVGVDPLTFHLPNVARWIQTGTVWQIDQFVPLLAQGNYPHNGDVVLLSTVLPWHNDFLVRLPITFYLVALAVAVFAVACGRGAARTARRRCTSPTSASRAGRGGSSRARRPASRRSPPRRAPTSPAPRPARARRRTPRPPRRRGRT